MKKQLSKGATNTNTAFGDWQLRDLGFYRPPQSIVLDHQIPPVMDGSAFYVFFFKLQCMSYGMSVDFSYTAVIIMLMTSPYATYPKCKSL